MLTVDDIAELACPYCRASLELCGAPAIPYLRDGELACTGCPQRYRITDGLAGLCRREVVHGRARLQRLVRDAVAPWHDTTVRALLPVLQGGTELQVRSAGLARLQLSGLQPRPDGRPVRILDVGIGVGAGVNLALIRRALPAGLPVEIWGCDQRANVLATLARGLRKRGRRDVRLLQADVHALPFADASFDRVVHVGAMANSRDSGQAIAEMGRVARPGTPIVIVGEQLDASEMPGPYHRVAFKMATWYREDPHCPIERIPPGAVAITQEQLSLFYYCLTYKMGGNRPAVSSLLRA